MLRGSINDFGIRGVSSSGVTLKFCLIEGLCQLPTPGGGAFQIPLSRLSITAHDYSGGGRWGHGVFRRRESEPIMIFGGSPDLSRVVFAPPSLSLSALENVVKSYARDLDGGRPSPLSLSGRALVPSQLSSTARRPSYSSTCFMESTVVFSPRTLGSFSEVLCLVSILSDNSLDRTMDSSDSLPSFLV